MADDGKDEGKEEGKGMEKDKSSTLRQHLRRLRSSKKMEREEEKKRAQKDDKVAEREEEEEEEREKEKQMQSGSQRVLMVQTENIEHEPFEQTQEVKVMCHIGEGRYCTGVKSASKENGSFAKLIRTFKI